MDHQVKNPKHAKLPATELHESFGEQLRIFFRRNALWFLVVALAWLLVQDIFGTHGVLAMHRSEVELQKIQGEIKELDEANAGLKGDVKDLNSDGITIQGLARKMGLAGKYEWVFITKQKPQNSRLPPSGK